MVGGTTSGYSLMGRAVIASTPASTITIEITPAKIGRSMKKRDRPMDRCQAGGSRAAGSDRSRTERSVRRAAGGGGRHLQRADRGRPAGGVVQRRLELRDDLGAGPDPLEPLDDDALAPGDRAGDDPEPVLELPELHRAVLDGGIRLHHVDVFLVLIGPDGAVLDQRRRVRMATGE